MSPPLILSPRWGQANRGPLRDADAGHTSAVTGRVTVLVVDDDDRVRRLTARMLRDRGFTALEAPSGQEALRLLGRHSEIRVVVSDIVMPGIHGVELAEAIRQGHPECRVVLVTGHAPDLLSQFGIRRPMHPVLMKPFAAEELVRHIRGVLGDLH